MSASGDHRHCKVCGKVCTSSEETCSKACRTERENRLRARRNMTYLLYGTIGILAILFLSRLIP